MHARQFVIWTMKIITIGILLQAVWINFIADPERIYLAAKIPPATWSRVSSGIAELIAVVLILIPRTTAWGALLSIVTMTGIIFFHLTTLDFIYSDSGLLFYMSIVCWICSAILFMIYRAQVLMRLHKIIS